MSKYDVFISHASEDKDALVRPLVGDLNALGLRVWYDEFSLKVGDRLTEAIDKGLSASRFGAVIISPAFLAKAWTDYEYRSLNALEMGRRKRILPIWFGVDRDDVLRYSPQLADRVAFLATGKTPLVTALKICETVSPETTKDLARRLALQQQMAESTISVRLGDVAPWPMLREPLEPEQLHRIRLIHEVLYEAQPVSWEKVVEDFQRDLPASREDEILIWERIAGAYLLIKRRYALSEQRELSRLFTHLLGLTIGAQPSPEHTEPWFNDATAAFIERP